MVESNKKTILKKVVFVDEDTNILCSCEEQFFKTCSLRLANNLPCVESFITITPITRDDDDLVDRAVREIDKSLKDTKSSIRSIEKRFKIF